MFDINTILTQALAAAVAEATKPLIERITTLETKLALTNATLPAEQAVQIDEAKMVEALNSQEWFWEKVRRFADAAAIRSIMNHEDSMHHYDKGAIGTLIEEAIDNHMEQASHFDEDDINTKIEEAIENHEENRTHGDEDDIEEMVQRLLNSASISISV